MDVRGPVGPVGIRQRDRQQRRSGVMRERGGAGRHPCLRPEEVDVDAGRSQVAVAEQTERAPAAQAVGEDVVRRSFTAGERDHFHSQRLAELHEPLEQRLRLKSFGDCRERHPGRCQPGAGVIPVAHVRQHQDHPLTGGIGVAQPPVIVAVHASDDVARLHPRQLEDLTPVAEVGAHPEVRDAPHLLFRCSRPEHATKVGLESARTLAVPRPNRVGESIELPARQRLRHAAHDSPSGRIGRIDELRVHHVRRTASPPGAGQGAGAPAGEPRRCAARR